MIWFRKTHTGLPRERVVIAMRIPESLQLIVPFELDKSTVMIALQPRGFVGTDSIAALIRTSSNGH
jgi:hypothetical protein